MKSCLEKMNLLEVVIGDELKQGDDYNRQESWDDDLKSCKIR